MAKTDSGQPIAFTDSLSCGAVYQALTNYSFERSRQLNEGAEAMYSHHGWPVVGETWGGMNTDIHDFKSTLTHNQVLEAITDAESRTEVLEGGYGGGAGMLCLGHKGGTGTSSRIVRKAGTENEHFTIGVLTQTNFGNKAMLQIGGVPIGKLLLREEAGNQQAEMDRATRTGSEGSMSPFSAPPLAIGTERY
jgi:D-aminopeptidase